MKGKYRYYCCCCKEELDDCYDTCPNCDSEYILLIKEVENDY